MEAGNLAVKDTEQFGGFWTNDPDALRTAQALVDAGRVSPEEHANLQQFITEGFTIIRGAVDDALISDLLASVDGVLAGNPPRKMTYWDAEGHHSVEAKADLMMGLEAKLIDIHAVSEPAQKVIFASKVTRFLELVFKNRPLAFQNLYFQRGSEQGIHQDTAFVPVADAPMEFVASWIALEDVEPGTGELLYVPGSHLLPHLLFANGSKQCRSDDPQIGQYTDLVRELYEGAGLKPERFLPRKGDVLFWSADLCHGGAPITAKGSTRRSIVTHYCPMSRRPEYARHADVDVEATPSGGHVISLT